MSMWTCHATTQDNRKPSLQQSGIDRAKTALLVTCGLPAAGKSSAVQALLQHNSDALFNCVHICFDSVISATMQSACLHQDQTRAAAAAALQADATESSSRISSEQPTASDAWQTSRASALSLLRVSLQSAARGSAQGHTLIIADDNMQFRSMRYECYQLAAAAGAAYMQLYLPCSAQEAVARNAVR